jgi:hypothetical protein
MTSQASADYESRAVRKRTGEASPRLKARLAGVFYLLSVITAVFAEFFAPGRLGIAAIVIPISCSVIMTLLIYSLFKVAGRSLPLLAVFFNLAGLTFEALQLQPQGVNIGMVLHGLYCLLLGYLILQSHFLPRFLGVLMSFAGLVWLIYLSPSLAHSLSSYKQPLASSARCCRCCGSL